MFEPLSSGLYFIKIKLLTFYGDNVEIAFLPLSEQSLFLFSVHVISDFPSSNSFLSISVPLLYL